MRLISLTLENFKGIRNLRISADGNDLDIYGDNAAGKTTIADAFYWLLFNKDSSSRGAGEWVKTLGPDGAPLGRLTHSVEGEFLVGARRVTLRKEYKEVWARQRGSASESLTGHTTDHFVNGVPSAKGEYDAFVKGICNEDMFRLLTDPACFNLTLSWQKRREILLDICGDVSDEDVIASNPSLARLTAVLGGRSVDDHKKAVARTKAEINGKLAEIPGRIDECDRLIRSADGLGPAPELEPLESELARLQSHRANLASGGGAAGVREEIARINAAIADLAAQRRMEATGAYDVAMLEVRARESELGSLLLSIRQLKSELEIDLAAYKDTETHLEQSRAEYIAVQAEEFCWSGQSDCPTCGQRLPDSNIEATRMKAEEAFNTSKADLLEQISKTGKALRDKATTLVARMAAKERQITEAEDSAELLGGQIRILRENAERLISSGSPAPSAELSGLDEQLAAAKGRLAAIEEDAATALAAVDADIARVKEQIREAQAAAATLASVESNRQRIAELEAEQKRLAKEFERLEGELFLIEEFIQAKVRLLTGRINDRFQIARFRLFRIQVNGGIEECCESVVDGVPYASLNQGKRLNVGLDIIDTLATHFGFAPPIVIDNAESITSIRPTQGQQIRLIVSASDKSLRVTGGEMTTETPQGVLL